MPRVPVALLLAGLLAACQSAPERPDHTVNQVALERFMGSWFVIAHIPLWPERNAWNAVEHYRKLDENRIRTTFIFRDGGPEGDLERFTPTAFVGDDGNPATWEMQFLWPFRADFRIVWLSDDYRHTMIGRKQRDHAWIMARQPHISDADYREMVRYLEEQEYPVAELRRVPHEWPGEPGYPELLR